MHLLLLAMHLNLPLLWPLLMDFLQFDNPLDCGDMFCSVKATKQIDSPPLVLVEVREALLVVYVFLSSKRIKKGNG